MNNIDKGRLGEEVAKRYLEKEGINIVDRNYRIKNGEIDIIGYQKDELIFIEVKSRSNVKYGYPSEAVNRDKIKTIKNVANYYINSNYILNKNIRFDVIEVYLVDKKIHHIINAF